MTKLTDRQIILKHDVSVRPRARMELAIVNRFLKAARDADYTMRVPEYEEDNMLPGSYDVRSAIFDLDYAYVVLFDANGEHLGWVYFVFGNDGYDCISDYTVGLREFLAPVETVAEECELWGGPIGDLMDEQAKEKETR